MQWVRLVRGAGTPGKLSPKVASCGSKKSCRETGSSAVQSPQLVVTCVPISKPWATNAEAAAFVIKVFG